jgi:hypothetical protein
MWIVRNMLVTLWMSCNTGANQSECTLYKLLTRHWKQRRKAAAACSI